MKEEKRKMYCLVCGKDTDHISLGKKGKLYECME